MGNGKEIKIWGQKWLPTPTNFCVQSPVSILNADSRVSELIDEGKKEWKKVLISNIFRREEAEVICLIPISRLRSIDKLYLGLTKKGKFSVTSAYFSDLKTLNKSEWEISDGNRELK